MIIKKRRGEDGYNIFTIRIPSELRQKLQALADECGMSRNAIIGEILSQSMESIVVK
jgi:predicted transcriptional regulator